MFIGLKRNVIVFICLLPNCLFNFVMCFLKFFLNTTKFEMINFSLKLIRNYDNEILKICKNKRIMKITKEKYYYHSFTVGFLNNTLGLVLYSLFKGCVPWICINEDDSNSIQWDWYFLQPFAQILETARAEKWSVVECDIQYNLFSPNFSDIFNYNDSLFQFWAMFYKKMIILNPRTERYIQKEREKLGFDKFDILGVLLRGTDYITLKPKYHPIQPKPEEIFTEVDKVIDNYKFIYVATEEQKLLQAVINRYGTNRVLENNRIYYDSYYEKSSGLLGDLQLGIMNENYDKGLKWLSSIYLLSFCDSIIAGNSGGVMAAVFLREKKNVHIINKGFY